MEAYKLFSKLNIKDYNNELEKILDNKMFSIDVKNILLSMLYKIENAYKDYQTIKIETLPKREIIEYLLKTIKEKCFEIEFIKLKEDEDDLKDEKFEIRVDKEKGKIECYPNEKSLLSAIWYMGEKKEELETTYDYTKDALQEMIYVGNNINHVEIIRDFNGWSWDISVEEIEDISYNIIHQSLLFIYGSNINYFNIDKLLKEETEEKITTEIFYEKNSKNDKIQEALDRAIMKIYLRKHEEKAKEINDIKEEKEKQLQFFQDKKAFVEKITEDKKQYNEKIEKIDKMINNTTLLREEYVSRNKDLPNKEKIFSISHLAEKLEIERQEFLDKIKKCNHMIDPREFVKEKGRLEKEVSFLNEITDIQKIENIYQEECLIKFCNEILKKAFKRISQIQEKNEVINWIYKIRYYALIPLDNEKSLKNIKELQEGFKKAIKQLAKKAHDLKVWEKFTEDEELSYQILKEIFYLNLINLESINIICQYKNGILSVQYDDTNILEKKIEIKIKDVKIKRKIKLFI